MTATDINNLLKAGKIAEAYNLSKQLLAEGNQPYSVYFYAGWAIVDMLKADAKSGAKENVLQYIDELKALNLPVEDARKIYSNVSWAARTLFAAEAGHINQQWCNQLFDAIKDFPLTKPDNSYSALLNAVLKLKEWQRLGEFVIWWGIENLLDEDYEPFVTANGTKSMSLAERYDIALCRHLLQTNDSETITSFISKQQDFTAKHPSYSYPPFYLAKLCLAVGDSEQAIEALKPFAKRKANDFWVWELLGDAHESADDRLSFYSKALLCGSREEGMLVGLYENAAELFEELGMLPEAKWLVERAITVRDQRQWRHTGKLYNLSIKPWFYPTIAKLDRNSLRQYAEKADEFLFGQTTTLKVCVSHVNEEKNFISFMTEDRKSGFFRRPKYLKQVKKGDYLMIKCSGLAEKGPTRVVTVKKA